LPADSRNDGVRYHLGDALRRLGRFKDADAEMAKVEAAGGVSRALVKEQRTRLQARFKTVVDASPVKGTKKG